MSSESEYEQRQFWEDGSIPLGNGIWEHIKPPIKTDYFEIYKKYEIYKKSGGTWEEFWDNEYKNK